MNMGWRPKFRLLLLAQAALFVSCKIKVGGPLDVAACVQHATLAPWCHTYACLGGSVDGWPTQGAARPVLGPRRVTAGAFCGLHTALFAWAGLQGRLLAIIAGSDVLGGGHEQRVGASTAASAGLPPCLQTRQFTTSQQTSATVWPLCSRITGPQSEGLARSRPHCSGEQLQMKGGGAAASTSTSI